MQYLIIKRDINTNVLKSVGQGHSLSNAKFQLHNIFCPDESNDKDALTATKYLKKPGYVYGYYKIPIAVYSILKHKPITNFQRELKEAIQQRMKNKNLNSSV